jgi:acetate kinase/phosphoesterase RecJ-like protein
MSRFYELIHQFDTIAVFRHQHPDPDALGSQLGLVTWLRSRFPQKRVFAVGQHKGPKPHLFQPADPIDEETLSNALVIVLDTANAARIDDQRYTLGKTILKIDHHPLGESYGTDEWIDETAASTSEIIASLIQGVMMDAPMDPAAARYLYMGILTDSLNFSTANTTARTLHAAAYLAQSGLDLPQINQDLYLMDAKEYTFINWLRQTACVEEGILYAIITVEDLQRLDIKPGIAKEHINVLGQVKDYEIWAMFIEQEEEGKMIFNGSIRSRSATVNDIAKNYNGGGHRLAAAVKKLDRAGITQVISDLKERHHETRLHL